MREVLDGLVLTCNLLGSNQILLPQSLKKDSHVGACDFVVVLELLPLLQLGDSGNIEQAQAWLKFIELSSNDGFPLPALQPLFRTIAILKHLEGLLDGDVKVPKDELLS